ncbi:MAG: hypothetical protein CMH63_00365 [Nanoarchaeota archaeon]|jgi:hypothetical protein|nr:hypothetical protein [Nanoarchaeota archaeon]|tara:strand:- start:5975 stop:6541 length:567 start_codon:yes stop_codon:yes gene_type:complete
MGVFGDIDLRNIVEGSQDAGVFDVLLPFLLVFAVIFAVLQKIELFGKDNKGKKVDGVVSLIMAAFLVSQTELVTILQGFLPRISMAIVVLLMLLLVVGVFTRNSDWQKGMLLVGVLVSIGLVLWAIGAAAGWDVPFVDSITDQDIAVLLMVGVFILVIYLIVKEPGDSSGGGGLDKVLNAIGLKQDKG